MRGNKRLKAGRLGFRAPLRVAWLFGLAVLCGVQLPGQPFTVEGPGVNAEDFRITTFASGLDFPLGMASLPDGSLLVTISEGSSFFNSTGSLVRFTDADMNGIADGPGSVVYGNLPGTLTGVRLAGSLVIVMGRAAPITVLRAGGSPGDPLTLVGRIMFSYPTGWTQHRHSALAVRKTPGATNQFDIVFQVGAQANFAVTTNTATMTNENIQGASGVLQGDSVYMLSLVDDGTNVSATNLTRVASGLRNAAGLAFHPTTGDLYFQDNGIDGLVNAGEPLSADELNFLARTNLGGPVEFFGFPTNYSAYRSNVVVGGAGIQPLLAFRPLPDPADGRESEGANDITFAPPDFPDGLNTGIFLGFHGVYGSGGINNEENPVVYADPATGTYFHFILGQQAGIGHLDGLHAAQDSLFIADLVSTGNPSSGKGAGVIYQVKCLNPPSRPSLGIRRVGDQVEIGWKRGVLQESSALSGPWADVPDAFSPQVFEGMGEGKFFRLRKEGAATGQ